MNPFLGKTILKFDTITAVTQFTRVALPCAFKFLFFMKRVGRMCILDQFFGASFLVSEFKHVIFFSPNLPQILKKPQKKKAGI